MGNYIEIRTRITLFWDLNSEFLIKDELLSTY